MFRRKKIADDLKVVTQVAGEQIAPGAGTLLWVLGASLAAGAAAYIVSRRRQKKKAAIKAAQSKADKPD